MKTHKISCLKFDVDFILETNCCYIYYTYLHFGDTLVASILLNKYWLQTQKALHVAFISGIVEW